MPRSSRNRLVDDRGRTLPNISEHQAMDAAAEKGNGTRSGFPFRRLAWLLWVLPTGLAIYAFDGAKVFVTVALFAAAVIGVLAVAMVPFVIQGMRQSAGRKGTPRHAGWLAAHGCCGACGYPIEGLEVAKDGCCTCPECGASWHAGRMTMLGRRPDAPGALRAIARVQGSSARTVDDRGVPLERPLLSPPWGSQRLLERATCYREYLGECSRALPRHFVIALLVFGCLVGGASLGATRDSGHLVLSALVALVIAVTVAALVTLSVRGRIATQIELMQARRCPHCDDPLSGSPGFDGCTACGKCGRAWRV